MATLCNVKEEKFIFHWKIRNLRCNVQLEGKHIMSPIFTLPFLRETKWVLQLYLERQGKFVGVLCRLIDQGPESVNIKFKLSTSFDITKNTYSEQNFRRNCCSRYEILRHNTLLKHSGALIIECELRYFHSNGPVSLPHVEKLFSPSKRFEQTTLCFDKILTEAPLDISLVTGSELRQIIHVASIKKFPFFIDVSRNNEDKNMTVKISRSEENIKTGTLLICSLSVWLDENVLIQLPALEHSFTPEYVDKVWRFKDSFDTPELILKFKNSEPKSIIWKIESTCFDGELHHESLWEESAEDSARGVQGKVSVLSDHMLRLYKEEKSYDVVLKVGNKTHHAHKAVLAAMSPVFTAMFKNKMAESVTSTVHFMDLEEDTVQGLVSFLYTGIVEDLTVEKAQRLFVVGDKYEIVPLRNQCRKYLTDNMSVQNVCEILYLSDKHNDFKLKKAAIKLIGFYDGRFLVSDEWENLEKANVKLAYDVLKKIALLS